MILIFISNYLNKFTLTSLLLIFMKPSSLVVKVGNFQYLKDDLIG